MTEAELWEMFFLASGSSASAFGLLLTMLFAYLATAYFVGSRLTGFQALVVSSLFVFSSTLSTMGTYGGILRALDFIAQLQEIHPDKRFVFVASERMTYIFPALCGALCFLSIPVSLLFMYQIRKNPKLGASSD